MLTPKRPKVLGPKPGAKVIKPKKTKLVAKNKLMKVCCPKSAVSNSNLETDIVAETLGGLSSFDRKEIGRESRPLGIASRRKEGKERHAEV
jgi:hypothetical protein